MKSMVTLYAMCLTLLVSFSAAADTLRVCPDGSGDFMTIQPAIDAADSGDVVSLCCDFEFTGPGNYEISYHGKAITVRSECGDPSRCTISGEWAHVGFIFNSGEGRESVLESVTIEACRNQFGNGGAVSCQFAAPTIVNCWMLGNEAPTGYGGAFASSGYTPPLLERCVLKYNHAIRGGGIGGRSPGCPRVHDCLLEGNWAERGGGMFCFHPPDPNAPIPDRQRLDLVTNTVFVDNTADYGGGLCLECWPEGPHIFLMIAQCTLVENTGNYGGGVACLYSALDGEKLIIAGSRDGAAAYCSGPQGGVSLKCSDVWGSEGGDWVGCLAGQDGIEGNFSADPQFCRDQNPESPYTLHRDSPCVLGNHPDGAQCAIIGALTIGCGVPPSAVDRDPHASGFLRLEPIAPNPVGSMSVIRYVIPAAEHDKVVHLGIYDSSGRLVRVLVSGYGWPGEHRISWDGSDAVGRRLAAGVYFCRLESGRGVRARRVLVIE